MFISNVHPEQGETELMNYNQHFVLNMPRRPRFQVFLCIQREEFHWQGDVKTVT